MEEDGTVKRYHRSTTAEEGVKRFHRSPAEKEDSYEVKHDEGQYAGMLVVLCIRR